MKYFIIVLFLHSFFVGAKSKITSVDFSKKDGVGKLSIHFQRLLTSTPEFEVRDKLIQVVVPASSVWPKIEKKVSIGRGNDLEISAYQYNKDIVRVRTVFPYSLKKDETKVSLIERGKSVDLFFPLPTTSSSVSRVSKDVYDESYLEELLSDQEIDKLEEGEKVVENADPPSDIPANPTETAPPMDEDQVALRMSADSAGEENTTGRFSFAPYIVKFASFLGLIFLGFFIVVKLLKKGVFNKGKLGFLSGTKVVEVLGKTYIAPKKSIMTIKAYDQVLLVGVDEKGMHFLTEIKNPIGFLKDGEREVVGDNFDTNVGRASLEDKKFNLKEILDKPAREEKRAMEKFSEKIKHKVRDLKSLQ